MQAKKGNQSRLSFQKQTSAVRSAMKGGIKLGLGLGLGLFTGLITNDAVADQFHYNNFIMGDRAVGMGGAYGGVSDDASGMIYNPAGLAFALSNDISGSASIRLFVV